MKGVNVLIQTVSITNNYPPPTKHEKKLILEFSLSSFDGPIDSNIEKELSYYLEYWSEGRNNLSVEILKKSLEECLRASVYNLEEKKLQEQYGNKMIQTCPNSSIAKWYLEAQKIKPNLPHIEEKIIVKIK